MKVLSGGRLSIPTGFLANLSWWKNETTPVTLELMDRGWAILHCTAKMKPSPSLSTDDLDATQRAALVGALSDRYRQFSLYGEDDCRIRLTKDVIALFGPPRGAILELFLQPLTDTIELLSLERREERLRFTTELLERL